MGYRVGRVSSSAVSLVAVAGRLWISWCVLGWAALFVSFSFLFLRISPNAHGLLQVRAVPCPMYLSTSIMELHCGPNNINVDKSSRDKTNPKD